MGNEQRTTNNEQRTTNTDNTTTQQQQRTTNNEQQTTNNEQRTTNNEQQTTNNEQRTTNNEQRTTNNEPMGFHDPLSAVLSLIVTFNTPKRTLHKGPGRGIGLTVIPAKSIKVFIELSGNNEQRTTNTDTHRHTDTQ